MMQCQKFYGQFGLDKEIYDRYFLEERFGFYIECGAYDGLTESTCKFFEESLQWTGINVEAAPRLFDRLKKNRPLSVNVSAALSNKEGYAVFMDIANGIADGNGSLSHTPNHKADLDCQGVHLTPVSVKTMTYKQLCDDYGVKHVDLFVLDTEGHELQVIEGMKDAPVPGVMCAEHGHCGLAKLIAALTPLGLKYDYHNGYNAFFIKK